MIRLLYFAWVRERVGLAEEDVDPPAEISDLDGLVGWLRGRGPGYSAAFEDLSAVRMAINQEFADPDAAVKPGDEVAFFPPVTGG